MMAAFGGTDVRCAGYATFGTLELSDLAIEAIQGRSACLLANHGMIAVGLGIEQAMWCAVEFETIARQYYLAMCAGVLVILSRREIDGTMEMLAG